MSGWWLVSYLVLWALVVALALLTLALARQIGTLHLRLGPRGALELDSEGPPLDEAPEPADARDLDGRPVTVGGPGHPQLLLFVSPGCPVCREVLPSLPVAARAGGMRPLVVSDAQDPADAVPAAGTDAGAPIVVGPAIAGAYGVPGTPYLVALDRLGVVRAKGTVNNLEQMEGLADTARRRLEEAPLH
ncbi:MAG: methylamine dehydrogenase accessory protein MauD [Actinomycetota bacterium]